MANRRPEDQETQEMSRPSKKQRVKEEESDPSTNPYLAHWQQESNGNYAQNGNGGGLSHFIRHQTTAKQAHEAESGPDNPFSGAPLSQRYFDILRTRRDLPVHKQR